MQMFFLFPLYVSVKGTIYDSNGESTTQANGRQVLLLFSYLGSKQSNGVRDWMLDMIKVPFLGAMLGVGNGYFKFLGIPFMKNSEWRGND